MTEYVLANWKDTGSGWGPDLPEELGYLLLAEPESQLEYGLFQISGSYEACASPALHPIPDSLNALLKSAESYPPAIALARDKIRAKLCNSREEFLAFFEEALRSSFVAQPESRLFWYVRRETSPAISPGGSITGSWAAGMLGIVSWRDGSREIILSTRTLSQILRSIRIGSVSDSHSLRYSL